MKQVVLVSMPFGSLYLPSIGLGLLKAGLTDRGIESKILYLTLKFAEKIGTSLYTDIADGKPAIYDLLGEWLFSIALFGSNPDREEEYVNEVLRGNSVFHREAHAGWRKPLPRESIERLLSIRHEVDSFLDSCLEEIVSYHPQVVTFTSTFQQNLASLSLAKRLKNRYPEVHIMMGGANCEGVMGGEIIRQFSFIDTVISGEGDLVFPTVVENLLQNKSVTDIRGIFTQDNIQKISLDSRYESTQLVENLDDIPYPDYDDYFEQFNDNSIVIRSPKDPELLFETSRGCWWGEKNHCTFCGLNGNSMKYRSKSPKRALDELLYLTNRYPDSSIQVVDNILDMKYFKTFIRDLASLELDVGLFYEVKANLRKEQVEMLAEAGIKEIQPGIESLSSQVLKLMRKGVSSIQNIQLLKWCREYSIHPYWNIIWGFPGESPEEYDLVAKLIPKITHLQPPDSVAKIRLDRFSPNFDFAKISGFTDVKPYPSYGYVYPLESAAVENLAYYFTFGYSQPQNVDTYTKPVRNAIALWQENYSDSALFYVEIDNILFIRDYRYIDRIKDSFREYKFTGVAKDIYIACDRIQTLRYLHESISSDMSIQELEEMLESFVNTNLMIKEENNYLSLAIAIGTYSPPLHLLNILSQ